MAGPLQTDWMNQALSLLGEEPVVDLSDQSLEQSSAATKLMRYMEIARDLTLARHGWSFALEYPTLPVAEIPNYENWRYPTVYLAPEDCVRVWEIAGVVFNGEESCWSPRWQLGTTEIEGSPRTIIRASPFVLSGFGISMGPYDDWIGWSSLPSSSDPDAQIMDEPNAGNMGPLNIAYVRRADWGAFPPHVRQAGAAELAAQGAYSVKGKLEAKKSFRDDAEAAAMIAISIDGPTEGNQPPLAPSIPAMLRAYART